MALRLTRAPILRQNYEASQDILRRASGAEVPRHQNIVARIASEMSNTQRMMNNRQPMSFSGGGGSGGARGGNEFERFVNAIAGKESGGNYRAINRSSGALGKYQIMPGNVGPWSKAALGRRVSTSEFLNNPQIQEAVARYMLRKYYNQYGAAGAAVAWYAGPGAVRTKMGSTRKQGAYPSINAYWRNVLARM